MVQILSYQAFAGSNILSEYNFKYIICDECHFFTSYGLFNTDTFEIISKIIWGGNEAIRIYMSATPDVVFAPIILEEYCYFGYTLNEEKKLATKFLNKQRSLTVMGLMNFPNNENLENEYRAIKADKERINQIVPKLSIDFYYMERSYDYIENFYYYKDDDELLNEVVKADEKNKWLIFVPSKRNKGNAMVKKLAEKNESLSVTFLTSKSKFLSDEPEEETREKESYEKLVNEQTFDEDVLITTSVLDNGVNIKAELIRIVVIDYCDRTEFIQMLRRLRIASLTKINLYVPLYSVEKIQKKLQWNIKALVDRLIFDIIDNKSKQSKFDRRLHRYTNDGSFATYNANAIWQLIDTMNFQMSLMRVFDPNFNLDTLIADLELKKPMDFSSDCRKVYNYYMGSGKFYIWSRNIVDILTTESDIKQRFDWTKEDEKRNEWGNRYDFKFDDNFTKYLFEVLIPNSFDKIIDKKIQTTFNRLNSNEQGNYRHYQNQTHANKAVSKYEELKNLQQFVKRFDFDVSTDEAKKLYDKQNHYLELGNAEFQKDLGFEKMLLNEQMKWIEKSIRDCDPIPTIGKKEIDDCDDYQHYVVKKAVAEEILEAYKTGNYCSKSLLEYHGIPHNEKGEPTPEEKEFCAKFRKGKPLTGADLKKPIPIDDSISEGLEYWLKSCLRGEDHQTYYVFVKKKKE